MKDLSQHLWTTVSISPDTYTAATDGSQVDAKDFNRATAVITAGAYTDGTHVFDLEHAEDDGTGSPDTWESVPTDHRVWDSDLDQTDSSGAVTIDAAGDAGTYTLGYTGDRRFLRVVTSSVTGTTNGATYGATLEFSEARRSTTTI